MKQCHVCLKKIKPGDREWFVYRGREIIGSCCSSGCFRAARDTVAPPAPRPEPKDPHQQEAFGT